MNFLPSSSLFLGLSSTASVRRPHREAWESVEGTELDDVCGKLRRPPSPRASTARDVTEPSPVGEMPGSPRDRLDHAEAAEGTQPAAVGCSRDSPPNKSYSSVAKVQGEPISLEGSREEEPRDAACPAPSREAESSPDRNISSSSSAARLPPALANGNGSCGHFAQYETVPSLRRASSSFSASMPTAPYERLLFQRQQQRRLMQQQATLMSLPTISSNGGSSDMLAAVLEEKHQKQEQLQQQAQQQHEHRRQEAMKRETEFAEANHSPTRSAVVAELKGPSLSPTVRLQLLHEVMWSTASTPNSSLGRSERKWWSMDDRNLETFIFSHHRTFFRRLGRGVPPAYRWRAWQAVCAYHREIHLQEGSEMHVYREPSDVGKLRDHLASLPKAVDTGAFMEAFEGGNVCPKLYAALAKHKSSYFNLILIDVPRTFPEIAAVDRDAQGMLFRILNAFANLRVEVGYCQGMNFVAGLLLLVSAFNEFEAFSFFCFIMVQQHLKEFFRERFPLLRKYIRAFDDIATVHLPKLREHFMEEGVLAPVYLHQWFLTLFVTSLPLRSALVVWDFFLAKGLHAVLQLAIALLRVLARFLIRLKFEDIIKFLKSLKCSGGVDDFRIGKMLVKQAAKIQIPSHIMKEISPSNLEAIIREAELEEQEENRSRNAAFIAAAAAVGNLPKATPNPLAFVSGSNSEEKEDDSLCKVAAGSSAPSEAAQRSAPSTPRDYSEEMVLIGFSPRAEEVVSQRQNDRKGGDISAARPWFSRNDSDPIANHEPAEGERSAAAAVTADGNTHTSRSGSHSDEFGEKAAAEALSRKEYYDRAESRWSPEEAAPAEGTSGEATTPEHRDGTGTPDLEEARNNLVNVPLASQEPESDEDGYELLEISNTDRRESHGTLEEGNRVGGADATSCNSSAFAEEYERDVAREREGSFIDTITRLWLAGR